MHRHRIAVLATLFLAFTSSARAEEEGCLADRKAVDAHIATFDDLDFNRFSKQDWDGFKFSHTQDVLVHWPDGHTTKGLKKHLEDMKYMFSYAPDTRIEDHPVKVGRGEWTAVYGNMSGTFSKPMKMPDGKIVQPTGKKFKLAMSTFCHWTKDGLFDEEFLFWDNQAFLTQIDFKPAH